MNKPPKATASYGSLVAAKIELHYGEVPVAIGTAFYYEKGNEKHLVTNWHNVTGREPSTGKVKHSKAAIPDTLRIVIPGIDEAGKLTTFIGELPLYADEDRQKPIWWEHPVHAENIDLVVIPLGKKPLGNAMDAINIVSVNDPQFSFREVSIHAGQDVFTIGFPRSMDGAGLAIWKRGSIATEPSLNLDNLPKLYIDTATREGMSGSPVFASGLVSFREAGKQLSSIAKRNRFIGIYSGRLGDDEFKAQLGVVWKESAILETIVGKKTGQTSF